MSTLQAVRGMSAGYIEYTVQRLRDELIDEDMRKHPSMAATYPRSYFYKWPDLTDKTANGLTDCIMHFIRLRGGQVERIVVMGKPVEQRTANGRTYGVKWVKSQMTRGSADIAATIRGKSVKIEVKIGADRQSDAQRQYQHQVEAAGGIYYVARNLSDFVVWYDLTFGGR